jgi:hypothetical protein
MVPNSTKRYVLAMETEFIAWEVIYIVLNIVYINSKLHNITYPFLVHHYHYKPANAMCDVQYVSSNSEAGRRSSVLIVQ